VGLREYPASESKRNCEMAFKNYFHSQLSEDTGSTLDPHSSSARVSRTTSAGFMSSRRPL
jgi:hypothetical protein